LRAIGSTGRVGAPLSVEDGCIRKLVVSVEAALPLEEAAPLAEGGDVAGWPEVLQGGYLTPSDSKPQKRQCCPCSPACTWSGHGPVSDGRQADGIWQGWSPLYRRTCGRGATLPSMKGWDAT
jgi:hypothetical protein